MRIGLLGGTFNPVHSGHIQGALSVQKEFALDEVWLIPAKMPVHKIYNEQASIDDRLAMLNLAIDGLPGFSVSNIELRRITPSYTVITAEELVDMYPSDHFYFIIGSDSYNDLHHWKDYAEILSMLDVIVLNRPGFPVINNHLTDDEKKKVLFSKNDLLDISSSEIRKKLKNNESVSDLLPGSVNNYIQEKGLYKK